MFYDGFKCNVAVKSGNVGAILYAHKREGSKYIGILDVC